VIEEMRVDGVAHESSPSSTRKHYLRPTRRCPSGQAGITSSFGLPASNFTAPDKVRCKWQLEGAEKRWREKHEPSASSATDRCLPGSYRFRVLAANSDGMWNETGASVAFLVLPFFWETWWFKTVAIATVCGVLALSVTLRLRHRHRLELERLERVNEMERERTRIARDMHDEIGSKLARISFLSETVNSEAQSAMQLNGAVASLSRTARETVTNRLTGCCGRSIHAMIRWKSYPVT